MVSVRDLYSEGFDHFIPYRTLLVFKSSLDCTVSYIRLKIKERKWGLHDLRNNNVMFSVRLVWPAVLILFATRSVWNMLEIMSSCGKIIINQLHSVELQGSYVWWTGKDVEGHVLVYLEELTPHFPNRHRAKHKSRFQKIQVKTWSPDLNKK